jgi:Ca2+-binding RTX toxin-like protein
VSIAGSTLTVVADGNDNVVAVTDPGGGNYGVTDTGSGATVAVGSGCASDGSSGALCPTAGLTAISVSDPSGANSVAIAGTIILAAALSGGSDKDTLTGGGGDDTISDNGSDELLNGGPGTDTLDFSTAGTCSISFDGVENDGPGAGGGRPSNVLGRQRGGEAGQLIPGTS